MMIDWLTVEVADPVGLPVNDGHICRVRTDGSLDWSTAARLCVEGSHSSNMTFRCVGADYVEDLSAAPYLRRRFKVRRSGLEVSGNPAKFLHGHNLFGSADAVDLLGRVIAKGAPAVWPHLDELPRLDLAGATVSRIDLTDSWVLDRDTEVLPLLRAIEERVWVPYRGRGVMDAGGSTLVFGRTEKGKRAKDWQLKLYSKGHEIAVHPLPFAAYGVPYLLDEVNRTVRVELTLRSAELKRLGMTKVGDWTPERVAEVWKAYVQKMDFGAATMNLDTLDLAELGLKTRHATALGAWKAGNDLRSCMSKTAFYRLRKELLELTGFDIALTRPKSNVVQLQRVITMREQGRPQWADQLTEALSRVA